MTISVSHTYTPVKRPFHLFLLGGACDNQAMSLGEQIKRSRKALGLSQQAVASRFGISRAAVAQWESGDTRPDHGKLMELAEILHISLSELLADTQDEPYSAPSRTEQSELSTLWAFLVPAEREQFMAQIRERAAHNKAVMEQLAPQDVRKRTVNVNERRLAQANHLPFADRRKKNATQ